MNAHVGAPGRVPTSIAVVGTVVVVAAFVLLAVRQRPPEVYFWLFLFHNGPTGVALLWLSRLVLLRRPGNRAGTVLLVMGVFSVAHVVVAAFADARFTAAGFVWPLGVDRVPLPSEMPLDASVPLWIMSWLWVPVPVLAITVLPLVFPDGRPPPGRGWRAVPVLAAAGGAALVAAGMRDSWPTADWTVDETPPEVVVLTGVGWLLVLAASITALVALGMRWYRSEGERARQFQVVGVTAGALALTMAGTSPWPQVWTPAGLVAFIALLAAYALAAARYRLHDLEPVLGRAAVAAVLSVLVAAVYLAVVVGVGRLVGQGTENTLLPLVAVGAVALLIEPARRRTRRLVDRALYRRRADRTEVLSRLAERSSDARSAADVLDEVTGLLLRGTGAARAEVALDGGGVVAAGRGADGEPVLAAPVEHGGERFGELRLYARAAADLVPDARPLADDVAHALGVVLHNDRLTGRLREHVEELRDSRRRLVEAHDRARRGLERDIHDGAQARLVAARLRVGVLRALAEAPGGPDAERIVAGLEVLGRELDAAVRSLRDLSRGLHPPMLEQDGPAAALRAATRDLPVPVRVTGDSGGRHERAVEDAVYFCCLEAVHNAVRHGGAGSVGVEVSGGGGRLRFLVSDDGCGFDPAAPRSGTGLTGIGDRIRALGGRVLVESAPGSGTRVSGEVPVRVEGRGRVPVQGRAEAQGRVEER
ncbi:sensor histidine kinase [Nocardiopsis protaetiae]|uniref:sensor histidine kinase n=1 Tax=Nocardiopsis protaetiae TaxID=3382270 RepID=UPI00387B0EAF